MWTPLVVVDLFAGRSLDRVLASEELFSCIKSSGIRVYVPRLFLVEVVGVLVRFLEPSIVEEVAERLRDEFVLIGDDLYFEESVEAALATGSRGADAYYIGLAVALNAVLATSDRVQARNAGRVGVEAYYILDEDERRKLLRLLGCQAGSSGGGP